MLPVRQIAYLVPDIAAAARTHAATFGSGPYFTMYHVPLASSVHRGIDREFDHSSAYGQWGDMMIEFVEVHSTDPSAFSDVYPAGSDQYGLHHTAIMVEQLDTAIARFEAQDMPLAQLSETTTGTAFAFMDATATLGHMIELYPASEVLTGFYDMVRDAARSWDGSEVIRNLGE